MKPIFARHCVKLLACSAVAVCYLSNITSIAAPLDKAACAKLAQNMQYMKALDVDKLMEKGPTWAASHLSPSDLGLIRQYIDLDEQMKFRCSAPGSLVHLKHLEEEDDEGNPGKPAETTEDSAKKQQSGDAGENAPPKAKPAKAQARTGDR